MPVPTRSNEWRNVRYCPKANISFLSHLVLYEPNDRRDDRPRNAAANWAARQPSLPLRKLGVKSADERFF
jgi:hypothetical protein